MINRLTISLLIFLGTGTVCAQSLKLLSWNLYLVPWPIHRSLQDDRAAALGPELAKTDYDVILMQEMFTRDYHDQVWEKLKAVYPYQTELFKDSGFFTLAGAGLWVVSKTPIRYLEHIFFDQCKGSDCFASKGAQLVEVEFRGHLVQILNTHTQAWPGDELDLIRLSQMTQMRNLLCKHKRPGVDQVIVGDLNVDAHDKLRVGQLLTTLNAKNPELTGTFKYSADARNSWRVDENNELLDYVLLTHDSSGKIENKKIMRREIVVDLKAVDLSDHFGIEAVYTPGNP